MRLRLLLGASAMTCLGATAYSHIYKDIYIYIYIQ